MSGHGDWADDLIEAVRIFRRYYSGKLPPIDCKHDVLFVDVHPGDMTPEERERLAAIGFVANDAGGFHSYRFGSC